MTGKILEQPTTDAATSEEEAPSIFSVITRYVVGAADASPPAEDGSRVLRLYSASGQAVVEVNLSDKLCAFIADKLTAVEIIEQGDDGAAA